MTRKNNCPQTNFFVSIGAGVNQKPLIEEAIKLGFHIIGVDKNVSAAGIHRCDIKILEPTDNDKEIYKKLRELLVDGNICAVFSKSFGYAIKTACYIANQLNIPMIPFERIDDFIDKNKMKSVFKENDIKSPHYKKVNKKKGSVNIKKSEFPLVIKPLTGHAKFSVRLLENNSDLEMYLKKADSSKRKDEYIIEKYIKGDEIIAVGIVHKNKFHLVDVIDKVKTSPPFFVDIMHISPSKYIELWDNIAGIGQKITEAFEIYTSPLIMELMVTEDKEIHVIEAVPEFGGEFIPEILVPVRTGYNFLRECIKALMDKNFTPPKRKKNKSAVVVKFITGKKGAFVSYNPELPKKIRGVIFTKIFKDVGAPVNKPAMNLDRIGVIITKARKIDDAIAIAMDAENSYNIRIK